jgi:hypothetical protein
MPSDTEICNLALDLIHAKNISSLSQTAPNAEKCRQHYEQVRDKLLQGFRWNFAVDEIPLTEDSTPPTIEEYEYQYIIPARVLRILEVYVDDYLTSLRWRRQGKRLLINVDSSTSTVKIRAICKVEDETFFDPYFTEVFVLRLASKLALAIPGSKADSIDFLKLEDKEIAEARRMHAIEDEEQNQEDPDRRHGASSWASAGR